MQLQELKNAYVPEEDIFSFQDTLLDNISFKVFIECSTKTFINSQKSILTDFVSDFTNTIKTSEELDTMDIREIFEQSLQLLNTKLKSFAEKMRNVDHFQLKWIIQLIADDTLMSSMIGNVSMMILRDQKAISSFSNSIDNKAKIDLCSDFIEWKLERDDQVIYVGLKFSDVMDAHDKAEMESILWEEETSDWVVSFLEELFQTRIEKESIWFIISYFVQWPSINITSRSNRWPKLAGLKWKEYLSKVGNKIQDSDTLKNIKRQLSENKIYVIAIILIILILIFCYWLITQILDTKNHTNQFKTSSGAYIDLNLWDLQDEITEFKALDPSSNLKTQKYNEITLELDFLESQGKWLEDVTDLRTQLEENFYEWFGITQFRTENELNKISWRDTTVFTFNSSDISQLWTLHTINVPNSMMIAWTAGAIIGASSDSSRGTLQAYNVWESLNDCIASLNSNWLYCYNTNGDIYMVSKTWITPVGTTDWDFRSWIGWLGTYNKRNLYVFNSSISSLGNVLLTRYQTNSDGTYANFQAWTPYSVNASGVNFGTFSSFLVDGNFLWRADGKLYLFRREDNAWSSLTYRQINIKWSNPLTENYSNNVKIISSSSTRYIYIYDRDQQLLTAYNTEKTKLNEDNKLSYQLVYMFSLKFDIDWVTVYDVDIPSSTWDRPEMYVLTSKWVNKIALYEYIEAMK